MDMNDVEEACDNNTVIRLFFANVGPMGYRWGIVRKATLLEFTMPAGVLPLSERLRRDFRFLRSLATSQIAIGALAVPFALSLAPLQTALVALGILAYAGFKVQRYSHAHQALKQLRLEERFFRQHLDERTLQDCMRRSEHLWDESHTLRALRGSQSMMMPLLLSREEKVRLVQDKFHATFRNLIPSRVNPEVIAPIVAAVVAVATRSDAPGLSTTMFLVGAVAAVILEGAYTERVHRLRARFLSYERALSIWTLAHDSLFRTTSPARGYRHTLLYRTQPVYSMRRAVNLRRARF